MSSNSSCTQQSNDLNEFHNRCRQLGLTAWEFDSQGSMVQRPQESGQIGAWLTSPELQPHIERVARAWLAEIQPQTVELFPTCWLLPIADSHSSCQAGITAVLAMGKTAFEQERFEVICQAAALDVQEAKLALEAMASYRSSDLETLVKILTWSRQDLAKALLDQQAINQFSDKLIQAYEESNLLFKLTRHMNCTTDPAEMMNAACEETHSIMPFDWTAIQFNRSSLVTGKLAGRLFLTGNLPCNTHDFRIAVNQLLMHSSLDHWTGLLQPDHHAVATTVKSEVVINPITHDDVLVGSLLAGNKHGPDSEVSSVETQFLDAMANLLSIFHQNISRFDELREMFMGTLQALTASVDAKDTYTRGHSERVAMLGAQLALAMGLTEMEIERVRITGLVHDVGKIGVPEAVLCKEGRLTFEEFEQIKKHPTIGYNILKDIPPLQDVLPGVLYHHERWDGKGYPDGLKKLDIPLYGRILALADTFDAMSSNRSYRSALTRDKVLEEIRSCAGTQLDPVLAELFVSLDFIAYDQTAQRHSSATAQ